MLRNIFILTIFLAALSCSLTAPTPRDIDPELAALPIKLDIFSARSFFSGADYERYYIEDDLVWRECGSVIPERPEIPRTKSMEGDDVLPIDPNLLIEERRIESLTGSQEAALKTKALETIVLLVDLQTKQKFPLPGSLASINDPGLFELRLTVGDRSAHVVTTVDAIADAETKPLTILNNLFASVRGVGPEICNQRTFFGISRLDL